MSASVTEHAWAQVADFEEEHGIELPALVRVDVQPKPIWLQRLVCFTGRRFLPTLAEAQRADHKRQKGETSRPVEHSSSAAHICIPQEDRAGARLMFAMMDGDAPPEVSVPQLRALLAAARLYVAEVLLDGFHSYLSPTFEGLKVHEVGTCTTKEYKKHCERLSCLDGDPRTHTHASCACLSTKSVLPRCVY